MPSDLTDKDYLLAVDVGFLATGLALFNVKMGYLCLVETECVKFKFKKDKDKYASVLDVEHVMEMSRRITAFIDKHGVRNMVVELPHGGAKSSRAARTMGMASAMIADIAVHKQLNVEWFTPTDIKKAATDKVSAEKDEVMAAMGSMFPGINDIPKVRREHIADACAVAVAWTKKERSEK